MSDSVLRDLVEFMAKSLVDHPDDVQVEESQEERTTQYILKAAQEDRGKIIGKNGRTVHAMRTILTAASTKLHQRSVLVIFE